MSDNSSENSTIKSDGGGDVTAKYSRLAAEYSKVRGQNTVLKKAILEEQNKNTQLNEIIREKEQTVRKSGQEIESLNFRNSQLLRRVTVLQEEIDLLNKNGKKKTKNSTDFSNGVVDNLLLEDDMKKTIIENAKLISKLNDNEEKHEEEIASLMSQISSLNDEINKKNILIQQMRTEYEITVDQLNRERQDFKRDYANNVNKLKETEIELSTLKSVYKQYVNDVGPKLEAVSRVLEKKIPFLDEEMFDKVLNPPNSQQELIREEFAKLNAALDNLIAETENVDLKRSQCSIAKVNDGRNYKSFASKYLRSLLKEKPEYIPYEEAIDNKKRLQELIMLNNSLSSELKNLDAAVVELEQEKVHLVNLCEVLQIKLGDKPQSSGSVNESAVEVTNELGRFLPTENINPEILTREKEIQNHMMSKLDEVVIMKEAACSKARTYLLECKTLQRRLENNAVEKQLLENKYLESNRISLELREELSTVCQNYEVQLSMMSDHLASVNEKLAQQSEEIDNLKYQLNNKMLKKGKQK
ncbi:hypothetical protein V9T40_008384 [Parthenolecanium corni]|uniref:Protein phosphatase 1 regulatory subunit 21 N-terminal domain-containing protein n=1 Tax=Parthenolecanium corni TaxID=536013 RepID=A0AAN9TN15_9HEMI